MKHAFAIASIAAVIVFNAFNVPNSLGSIPPAKGPDIRIVDGKVSIQADAIPLGRLLRLLDEATGMKSKVAPELANRSISIRFTDLNFDEAVHKIFEGQSLDYVVVGRQSILVTRPSQNIANNRGAMRPYSPAAGADRRKSDTASSSGQPNPAASCSLGLFRLPFGPMPNPRANTQYSGQPQPNGMAPMVTPGQPANTNPFNNNGIFGNSNGLPGFNSPSTLPTLPSNNPFAPSSANPGEYRRHGNAS